MYGKSIYVVKLLAKYSLTPNDGQNIDDNGFYQMQIADIEFQSSLKFEYIHQVSGFFTIRIRPKRKENEISV